VSANRRHAATAVALACAGLLTPPLAAQQPARPVRIGTLGSTDGATWQAFRDELRRRGWVEGRNLELVQRWSQGFGDLLPPLAAELVREEVGGLEIWVSHRDRQAGLEALQREKAQSSSRRRLLEPTAAR